MCIRDRYITPHFVKKISNDSIQIKFREKKYSTINSKHYEKIIGGMFDVIEKGTAQNSKIRDIEIVGKTGTAENFTKINGIRRQLTDHSIFIGFAPKDDPKIAIAVFIEKACGAHMLPLILSNPCLLYTSPSPRDRTRSRMPSSA